LKKLVTAIAAMLLMILPVPALAATGDAHRAPTPVATHQAAFTGASRTVANETPYIRPGGSYHSGYRAPSSRVGGSRYSGQYSGQYSGSYGGTSTPRYGWGGFGSHLFSFGSGLLLGSLLHPFGGYYGWGPYYAYHGFSIFSLLIDLLLIFIAWRLIRRLLRR
jgi:hypothetical protein